MGKHRPNILRSHQGVNHLNIRQQIEENNAKTAYILSFPVPKYDLDFFSQTFGQIRIKQLSKNSAKNKENIELFFQEFHKVSDIIITVKDVENPIIDGQNEIILEFKNHERRLSTGFFRALLSKEIKDEYEKRYPDTCENNRYKRLEDLISDYSPTNKGFVLENYDYENE